MDNTFSYATKNWLTTNNLYPYTGSKGACLHLKEAVKIDGYMNATGCSQLEDSIINQPVSVVVDGANFKSY